MYFSKMPPVCDRRVYCSHHSFRLLPEHPSSLARSSLGGRSLNLLMGSVNRWFTAEQKRGEKGEGEKESDQQQQASEMHCSVEIGSPYSISFVSCCLSSRPKQWKNTRGSECLPFALPSFFPSSLPPSMPRSLSCSVAEKGEKLLSQQKRESREGKRSTW
jgi:hypothetical protein